ncbi:MAG: sigma-54-dependent Fis family transcriptional regulator, partial [Bdellovibrionales bacterium]|nr:sigma-54-dependent Fis family transcriptional regulator [Bdellovibrionales bacterium]
HFFTFSSTFLSSVYCRGYCCMEAVEGKKVLIVDPDGDAARHLSEILRGAGYEPEAAVDRPTALQALQKNAFSIVLCDLPNPEAEQAFTKELAEHQRDTTLILMSESAGPQQVDEALEAIQRGADDYLAKPFEAVDVLVTVKKAKERNRLRSENEMLRRQVAKRYSFSNIVANSPSMLEIFETIKKVADYRTTVLLYGESGTGKELIAKAIHHNSARKNRRFVAINCGAIPENLLESELFGHKRGAFTDATRDKKGLLEEAEGGTILLDEIGELPLHLQVKLLRVLQENEIRPVGDSRVIPIDVRVIAATLRDLENDVIEGRFRDDLFYRLNVITLKIPPLRERKEDIPLLVNFFIKKNQEKLGLPVYGISKEAIAILMDHDWPGNIRELENCVERSMILTEGDEISVASLPRTVRGSAPTASGNQGNPAALLPTDELSIKQHTRVLEESLIRRALEKTKGNRTHAAKLLEISHRTLLYKLKEYQLSGDDNEVDAG